MCPKNLRNRSRKPQHTLTDFIYSCLWFFKYIKP